MFEVDDAERSAFEQLTERHEVRFDPRPLRSDTVGDHADAEVVSVFIHSQLDADVLARVDALQLVATRSTGVSHIDGEWCDAHGVVVANVPSYGSSTVAEHALALLLAVSRNIVEAVGRTRRGEFSAAGLQGRDLAGRTLGVVGTGDIGTHMARLATGIGMDVLAVDVQPDEEAAARIGFRYVTLEELLEQADAVSLHVPGGDATHHLLGPDQFARMRPGTVLVNTSRGSVVDTEALVQALHDGTVAAAALDVLEEETVAREEAEILRVLDREEPDPDELERILVDHVLLRMDNVVVTPHIAYDTDGAVQEIVDTTVENIESFARGAPSNVVVGGSVVGGSVVGGS